jgi:hypothetical protein
VAVFAILSMSGGVLLGYVLLATGWFDTPPPDTPAPDPTPTSGQSVEFTNIVIEGDLNEQAIEAALSSTRSDMEMCRRPQRAQLRLEAHVSPPGSGDSRLSQVRALPAEEEPGEVARCCIAAFRNGIPPGWNPGNSGRVTFEITLPER